MIPVGNSKLFMQCRHSLLSWITHQVRFVVESRANAIIYYVMTLVLYLVLFQNCLIEVRVLSGTPLCQVSPL